MAGGASPDDAPDDAVVTVPAPLERVRAYLGGARSDPQDWLDPVSLLDFAP